MDAENMRKVSFVSSAFLSFRNRWPLVKLVEKVRNDTVISGKKY
jgi:hypothetical protein